MTHLLPSLMILALAIGIFSGYPVALLLGGLSVIFLVLGGVPIASFGLVASRVYGSVLENWILAAIPLFVFMGIMLDRSKIAENLLTELDGLLGARPGGLGLAVIIIGVVMAASTGIIGASVVLMGSLALPLMLRQGYSKSVAIGTILGSGTLGILIPPSIMLVVFGEVMQVPIGGLFAAALVPGLTLGLLYAAYIAGVAIFAPHRVPAGPAISSKGLRELLPRFLGNLLIPAALMASVLISIIVGLATPTEGAAIGALGAFLLALIKGRLSGGVMWESVKDATLTTSMILVLAIGATAFSLVFQRVGGNRMIEDSIALMGSNPYVVVLGIMFLIFLLGFFLEWIEISFLVLPLFTPIVANLDFGDAFAGRTEVVLWFATLVAVNLQTSFLTPPFGYALFYLKTIAPPNVSTKDIYNGVFPIVALQILCLATLMLFPMIALWLPSVM